MCFELFESRSKNLRMSETKINYWLKRLLNCNISAILVAIIKLIKISKEKQIGYYLIRYIKQKIF